MRPVASRRRLIGFAFSLDLPLLLGIGALLALSLVLIYAATYEVHGWRMVGRQVAWIAVGGALYLGLATTPVPTLRHYAPPIYLGCVALVLLTYGFGVEAFGARRWLLIGGVRFQPSEFLKLGTILMLARLAEQFHEVEVERKVAPLAGMALVTSLTFLVIAKQPDLGTAATTFAVCGGMFVVMGLPFWGLVSLVLLGVLPIGLPALMASMELPVSLEVALPLAGALTLAFLAVLAVARALRLDLVLWKPTLLYLAIVAGVLLGPEVWGALNPYQRLRLTGFLAPELDPRGSGYNLIQSLIAIGSGGVWGQGLGKGSQTNLGFLPHKHTDFIFSVLGEQLGFVGVMVLLGLFLLVFGRLFWLAARARSGFGALVITGVACLLAFQTMVNMSMSLGMAPITGIPLPFVSYGGSAMIGYFMMLGLVQAIMLEPDHASGRVGRGLGKGGW